MRTSRSAQQVGRGHGAGAGGKEVGEHHIKGKAAGQVEQEPAPYVVPRDDAEVSHNEALVVPACDEGERDIDHEYEVNAKLEHLH